MNTPENRSAHAFQTPIAALVGGIGGVLTASYFSTRASRWAALTSPKTI